MPSGHSSGGFSHSSGHFSGGNSRSFSHSSGHFGGGSGSSFSSRGSFSGIRPTHRPWYRPRVIVFGGRRVYLGTGRASAFSALGVLVVIALLVSAFLGFSWYNVEDTLSEQRSVYTYYQAMAQYAYDHPEYQYWADVDEPEEYNYSGKYCINYSFETTSGSNVVKGFSFFVYNFDEAFQIWDHGNGKIKVALDCENTNIGSLADSVPLDYKDMTFEDDEEYVDNLNSRNSLRIGTFIMVGVSILLAAAAVLVPMTAKKATDEQIAANDSSTDDAKNKSTPEGTWRCSYCSALNDNSKERCDGCGAKRQH